MNFPRLSLPESELKLKKEGERVFVHCKARKKWIVLTPEEWVRQHFISYLVTELSYPPSLMAVEKEIKVHGLKKRFDICCSDQTGTLKLLVECKSADVELTEETFNQAARYNLTLKVSFLVITNGVTHFCAKVNPDGNSVEYLKKIPSYTEVKR